MKKALFFLTASILHVTAFSQPKLIEANNDFAFRIYKSTKPDSSNFFISPLSLNIALAIANEGAASITRQEMDNLLSLNGVGERASLYRQLIQKTTNLNDEDFKFCLRLMEGKGTNSLTIANSLWVNDACTIDDNFKASIQRNYNSDVFSFNNSDIESANKMLNAWISEKTNEKITDMPDVDSSVMLSIINAIHFVGEWDVQFDVEETTKKKFQGLNKKKFDVDFMHIQSHYKYYEDGDIQSIQLPYKCDQFSMIVILPNKKYGLLEVEKKMNPAFLSKIRSGYSSEVILDLPKFRIESMIEPKEEIEKMGYPLMFSNRADFSRMAKDTLKIGKIIHKTFIEVDEKRTEAAAVTEIDMVITGYGGGEPKAPPPPKIFNADHPFMFLITDNRTGAVVFTGRFVTE